MRTNLFDFAWSLKAAAAAGRMKDIGHSQPWLIDDLADVCRKWLPETDLPPLLRHWHCGAVEADGYKEEAVHVQWH